MRPVTANIVAAAVLFSASAPAWADCEESRQQFNEQIMSGELRGEHFQDLSRDLRQLAGSARILERLEKEDTCEQLVTAMRELAEDPPQNVGLRRLSDLGGKLSVDEIMDADVRSSDNEHVGTINDIVLNSDGTPAYAVIEYGGFLGLGEEQIAIPFDVLKISPDRDAFFLPVTDEQLENAPRFERDSFDWANDTAWRTEVDAFFGAAATSEN